MLKSLVMDVIKAGLEMEVNNQVLVEGNLIVVKFYDGSKTIIFPKSKLISKRRRTNEKDKKTRLWLWKRVRSKRT